MAELKLIYIVLLITGILFAEWIDINGHAAVEDEIIIKIEEFYMPASGLAAELDFSRLPNFQSYPEFKSINPLFIRAVTPEHQEYDLNRYFRLILNSEKISSDLLSFLEKFTEVENVIPAGTVHKYVRASPLGSNDPVPCKVTSDPSTTS
mgnify:CR=1 FL=1